MNLRSNILIISLLIILCSSGCKTISKVSDNTRISLDTIYINKYLRDSIYMRDSIYVWSKNDTVYMNKYLTKYIEKIKLDTIYKSTNDTIIKYELNIIEKRYVPAIYKWSLGILIVLIIGIVGYTAVKLYLKFKL